MLGVRLILVAVCTLSLFEFHNAQLLTCRQGPCKNGAACVDQPQNAMYAYKCNCVGGWGGINCDIANPAVGMMNQPPPQNGPNGNFQFGQNNPVVNPNQNPNQNGIGIDRVAKQTQVGIGAGLQNNGIGGPVGAVQPVPGAPNANQNQNQNQNQQNQQNQQQRLNPNNHHYHNQKEWDPNDPYYNNVGPNWNNNNQYGTNQWNGQNNWNNNNQNGLNNWNTNNPNWNSNNQDFNNPNSPYYNQNYRPNDPNYRPNDPNYRPNDPNYRPNDPNYRPNGVNYNPNNPNWNLYPNNPNYPLNPQSNPLNPSYPYQTGANYNRPGYPGYNSYGPGPHIGCASSPCMNNGICEANSGGVGAGVGMNYRCICRYGFSGYRCEHYYDPKGTLLGIILGTVIPFIVICVVVTVIVICCCCRSKNKK